MELIEQKLRDCLHDLLMGKNSPNNIRITRDELLYIKGRSKDIGEMLTIELELDDNLIREASSLISPSIFTRPLDVSTKKRYENYQGKYTLKSEITQKFSYQDYQILQSRNSNESKFEEIKKSVPTPILNYLLFTILKRRKLLEFDVFDYSSSIYERTCKLDLVLFNKKSLSHSDGEIKLEYFKYYIQEEFEKLKYELEKYFSKKHYQTHIQILQYYEKKFISRKKEQSDANYKKCYEIIIIGIRNLVEHLKVYFGIIENKSEIPAKLQWNTSYKKFIDFFEVLINEEELQYKGEKDKYAIYYNLLDKIEVENSGVVSIDSVMKDLGFTTNNILKKPDLCKLDYKKSMTTFARTFSTLIDISVPMKSTLQLNGKSKRDPIVKKLFNIFSIKSENAPYQEIEEQSLIATFKSIK